MNGPQDRTNPVRGNQSSNVRFGLPAFQDSVKRNVNEERCEPNGHGEGGSSDREALK